VVVSEASPAEVKLTAAMENELARLVLLKIPATYLGHAFPGLPSSNLDMRSVEALERRGFVECQLHRWKMPHDKAERVTPTYRATAAGRAHLASSGALK
jgi:hypothetical protein